MRGVVSEEWRSAVMQRHRKDTIVGASVNKHLLGSAAGVSSGGLVRVKCSPSSSGRDVLISCLGISHVSTHVATTSSASPLNLSTLAYADVGGLNGGRGLMCDWLADDHLLVGTDTGMLALYNPRTGSGSSGGDDAVSSNDDTGEKRKRRHHGQHSSRSHAAAAAATSVISCSTFSHLAHPDAALQGAVSGSDRAGNQSSSLSLTCVSACPYDSNAFATASGEFFRVWTLGQGVPSPVLTHKPAPGSVVRLFEWSPLIQPVAALAAEPRSFLFTDIRSDKPLAGRHDHAHSQPITAMAWNPYVPYWFATGGADSQVKVWDMRYSAVPVATISDLVGPVTSLEWDPKHSELLAVGTTDAELSLFSMELDPHRLLLRKPTPSSVLSVGFLPFGGSVSDCFAVTDTGDFVVASLDETFFSPLRVVQSMFSPQNALSSGNAPVLDQKAVEVESKIYARDIQAGFSMAYKRACELNALNKTEEALTLLNVCFEATPEQITANDFSAALAPPPDSFLEEAKFFACHVPLGYHSRFQTRLDDTLTESLDRLKLVLDLKTMVRQKLPEEIVPRHLEIVTSLRSDKNRIDVTLLYQVVATVMEYDYLQAVRMALDYAAIFATQRLFNQFAPIAHLVLYPTVFDEEVAAASPLLTNCLGMLGVSRDGNDEESEFTTRSAADGGARNNGPTAPPVVTVPGASGGKENITFDVLLSKPEVMLDQMRFVKMFLEASGSSNPAEEIRTLMKKRARLKPFVLSFEAISVYLNILAAANEFHHFFSFLIEAENKLAACTTSNIVQLFYPLGLRQLSALVSKPLSDSKVDLTELENSICSMVYLTSHRMEESVILNEKLILQFRKTLTNIEPALESALRSLSKVPDPAMLEKGIPAKAQAAVKAKQILTAIEESVGSTHDLTPLKAQITDIQRVLTHFANKQ